MDRFQPLQPLEEAYREFDFDDVLGSATIASATVTAKIVSTGVDVTATLTDAGKQDISTDTSSCFVWCIGLSDGVDYQITCKIVGSDGSKHELKGLLYVGAVPPTAVTGTGPGLVIAPVLEPISLAELKTHLRVDCTAEDEYLDALITVGRREVESITRRALLTQTWDYCLQGWPDVNYIKLPYGNLQSSGLSVKWKDTDGTETTLTLTTDYLVETNGDGVGRIVLPDGASWPSDALYPSNPITIRFACGWTTATAVPAEIKAACKFAAESIYYHGDRDDVLKPVIQRLLASYRIWDEF